MEKFTDVLEEMRKIHEVKNHDYSPEDEFGNFAESEKVGVEDWKGAFVRLQDKYTRACNLIRGKEQKVKDEALEDTLLDLANYAVIVLCLLQNRETARSEKNFKLNDCAYRSNNCMPYLDIPVTEQEDREFKIKDII